MISGTSPPKIKTVKAPDRVVTNAFNKPDFLCGRGDGAVSISALYEIQKNNFCRRGGLSLGLASHFLKGIDAKPYRQPQARTGSTATATPHSDSPVPKLDERSAHRAGRVRHQPALKVRRDILATVLAVKVPPLRGPLPPGDPPLTAARGRWDLPSIDCKAGVCVERTTAKRQF